MVAAKGTDKLSSTEGISSTSAQMELMKKIRPATCTISNGTLIVSVTPNQATRHMAPNVDPMINASVPAMDFVGLKNHLLFLPKRRPTMSAKPSPRERIDIGTTPRRFLVQKIIVEAVTTIRYINGPASASDVSPLLETAVANSASSSLCVIICQNCICNTLFFVDLKN